MTLGELCRKARKALVPLYGEGEARAMVREIMAHLRGYTVADLLLKDSLEVTEWLEDEVGRIVGRLLKHEPLQYVLGEAGFFGYSFRVTPDVLIPRPETEELVDMIVHRWGGDKDLRVLDVCTGSGCIAISLAMALSFADVKGTDISVRALEVACENGKRIGARVDFEVADALDMRRESDVWDIIVSNPPYIAPDEKDEMERNVLDYEPHMALFVPGTDPLVFYRAISGYAADGLKPGGGLYFEINPRFATELAGWLTGEGWRDVEVARDIHGRERFISCVK